MAGIYLTPQQEHHLMFMIFIPKYEDTGWIGLGDKSRYRKKNGIVYIVFQATVEVGGWTNIFTLPLDCAPIGQCFFMLSENSTDPKNFVNGYIQGDGNIATLSPKTGEYLGSVSYPVK